MSDAVVTDRLLLRRPNADDLAAYFAVFGNAAANAANPRGRCDDLVEAAAALRGHVDYWETHGFDVWAVSLREAPDQVIGFGGIGVRRYGGVERVNLGYGLHESVFGRGYAKEIARAGVAAARARMSSGALWARVQRDNATSRRVLESVGLALDAAADGDELWYRLDLGRQTG
jgi:RimJ/RimL family protein N-acetyltransferase